MVERMDRPLSFEEYFEQNDSRVGKSPASARKTAREAPRSAGARRRTLRRRTSGKRRVDNIIEGLTSGSQLSDLEQLRLFEDLEREVDRFRHKEHLTDAEARRASSVALEFMKHEHHNWKEKHRSTQSEKKASAAFRIKSLLRSWYITKKLSRAFHVLSVAMYNGRRHEETREHHARELARQQKHHEHREKSWREAQHKEKRERGLRHALRVWHVGITRSNIDAEGCVRGIGLGARARSGWRLHRDAAIRREAEALVAKRRAEAAAMKCRLRFLRALEHRAWNAWVGHVGERKRLRSALKHATLRFRHSKAQSRRNDLFARIATSVHDPLRALKRLERLDVWPAVRTWKENFAALRDAEVSAARMAKGALRAMTSVETRWLRRGMASWRARRDASRRVQKLVARWKASKLAAGVRTWRDHGRARKCLKDAAALVAKALGRMKKVEWARAARAATASRRKILKVVSKLRHRATAAGFGTWARAARAALEAKMVRVILRLGHRAAAGGFGKWRAFVDADRGAERSVLRVLGKLGHRAQARAFRAWFDACKKERLLEQRVLHVLLKMVHRAAAAGFRRWAFVDRSLRRVESRVRRVLSRMSHRRLVAALNQWKLVEAFASQLETKVFRVLGKLSNRAARRVPPVGLRPPVRRAARGQGAARRLPHGPHQALGRLRRLGRQGRGAARRRAEDGAVRASSVAPAAGAAMRQWVDVQRFERRAEAKIGKTLRRMEHRSAGLAWTQWRNVVARAQRRGQGAPVPRAHGPPRGGPGTHALGRRRRAPRPRRRPAARGAAQDEPPPPRGRARRWTFAVRVALANERKMER
ncbi:hypothetical protein JL720_15425 [Aureococcus anophagefferens]|nr:hypothetical protein JL720_15425 [Aureococcus anophagefferens]